MSTINLHYTHADQSMQNEVRRTKVWPDAYFVNTSSEGSGESAHPSESSLLVAAVMTEISSYAPYKFRYTGKINILGIYSPVSQE